VARGRCSERLAGTGAYLPILEALDGLLKGEGRETAARAMRLLAATWYVQVAPPAPDDPSFGGLTAELRTASPERMKRDLGAFLQEASRPRPLVLFLEDLHWADLSTVDLLAYLGPRCAGQRLLLVLTYRPSDLLRDRHPFLVLKRDLQARGACRELVLDLLSRDDLERYQALAFPGHDFPTAFSDLLYLRTGGNPLFMVELLRHLRDRNALAEEAGRWVLARALPDLEGELPESVRGLVQRKIDQLGEQDRQLLVAGSVQGHEFDSAVLARALGRDPAEVEERLAVLERDFAFVRLIGEPEFPDGTRTVRCAFVHVLYENALYASLRPARRAALSAAVAQALLGFMGEQAAGVASQLALLFEAARDWERAVHHFWLAARGAARIHAFQEAIELARRGLEVLGRLPAGAARDRQELRLLLARGAAEIPRRGYAAPEVERTYARARELCRQVGEPAEVSDALLALHAVCLHRGQLEPARELAEEALRLASGPEEDLLRARAEFMLGATLYLRGEFAPAGRHLEEADALFRALASRPRPWRRVVDSRLFLFNQGFLALVLWHLGHSDRALARAREAQALALPLGPVGQGFALFVLAYVHGFRGDPPRAAALAEDLVRLSDEHDLIQYEAHGALVRGWALALRGQHDSGAEQVRRALGACGAPGMIARTVWLAVLADALGKAGRTVEALRTLDEAQAATAGGGAPLRGRAAPPSGRAAPGSGRTGGPGPRRRAGVSVPPGPGHRRGPAGALAGPAGGDQPGTAPEAAGPARGGTPATGPELRLVHRGARDGRPEGRPGTPGRPRALTRGPRGSKLDPGSWLFVLCAPAPRGAPAAPPAALAGGPRLLGKPGHEARGLPFRVNGCEMTNQDPWLFEERAVPFAKLVLTEHHDVVPYAGAVMGVDLLVEIRRHGNSMRRRLFGVQIVPYMDLPDAQEADERVRSLVGGDGVEPTLPVCVFVIGVRKPEGIYRWVVEPFDDGRAVLRRDGEATWQPLDEAGGDRLIGQVNAWYDALDGGATPKACGRRSKAES
jgi:tetratricopeptide (TPR) repeat protein